MGRPLLSLCMIARDEEDVLPRCLQSARAYADEIVLADTGSRDRTVEVARAFGAAVHRVAWQDDFAAARNAALARATGRFVLALDADEWIEAGPAPGRLRALLRETGEEAFRVELHDRLDAGRERRSSLVRLFRNRPEHRYAGAIHEQITPSIAARLGSATIRPADSGLVVGHDGYLHERRAGRGKLERNLAILRRRVAEDPRDVVSGYFLLRELLPMRGGRALPGAHLAEALALGERIAREGAALSAPIARDASRLHAAALIAANRPEEALRRLDETGHEGNDAAVLRVEAALSRDPLDRAELERAAERLEACFDRAAPDVLPAHDPALAGPVARAVAARARLRLGQIEEARRLAAEAAAMSGAGAAAHVALAAIARAKGELLPAVRACMDGLQVDPQDPWAWATLGETLLQAGAAGDAREPLENAARLVPGWGTIDEALATAILLGDRPDSLEERASGMCGPSGEAALVLGRAISGQDGAVTPGDDEVLAALRRIVRRVAAAGRPDLLQRLERGVRESVAG